MGEVELSAPVLRPLPYHREVVAYLKEHEPEIWDWSISLEARELQAEELRTALLRETYRLSPDSHPKAHEAAMRVAERLGITAPVTLYQAGGPSMNAGLTYLPEEIHVVLHGPVLERLDSTELVALLGHEIAHYRLWSEEAGDILTADRILRQTVADPRASASHGETARLFQLHTELYADRGAALAGADPGPAISTLVKIQTGIDSADPAAYLRQAEELETADSSASKARSHPEIFLRAQAVDKWWRGDAGLDDWLRRRLRGPLAVQRLDLVGQLEATRLTRRLVGDFLRRSEFTSEAHSNQAKTYFPDWAGTGNADDKVDAAMVAEIDPATRQFLAAVILDLALCDEEVREEGMMEAGRYAQSLELVEPLLETLRRDVRLSKREIDALNRRLRKEAQV